METAAALLAVLEHLTDRAAERDPRDRRRSSFVIEALRTELEDLKRLTGVQ
jgi:hypothetical protein